MALRYLAGRALALAVTLLAASAVIFLIVDIVPGDPARFMMGLNADPAALASVRAELGLDAPPLARYGAWLLGLIQGDLGVSYTYRVPVADLVAERAALSLPLALAAFVVSTIVAIAAGAASVLRRGGPTDIAVSALAQAGVALPNFWLAILLVLAFSVGLGWLPAGGFPGWDAPWPAPLASLTLPMLALALPQAAILTRTVRTALLAEEGADYIRTARAKGAGRVRVILFHALPNALLPILAILGLQFTFLLAGAVIVENVFYLPGLGRLVLQAITQRDLIVVRSVVMLLVFVSIVVALCVDVLSAWADPRLRRPAVS